ncbi:hypothetical protein [Sinomonas sp. P47F7]|uniref:hypothetical protein n=1 Tax=Sinomonas sp. P47F7 TaxID=3410987 RepID=UPI003BF4930A
MTAALATTIDSQDGWHAVIEAVHLARDWVADVLAVGDDGQRVAFEVQRSKSDPSRVFSAIRPVLA